MLSTAIEISTAFTIRWMQLWFTANLLNLAELYEARKTLLKDMVTIRYTVTVAMI